MGGRAGKEDFVGGGEFVVLDFAFSYFQTADFARDLDNGGAGDADQAVGGRWWRIEFTVGDEEEVFAASFGDGIVGVEHNCLVVAPSDGVGLGEYVGSVQGGDFGAGRDGVVAWLSPIGGYAVDRAAIAAYVVTEGNGHYEEIVGQFREVQLGDGFGAFVGNWSDIEVLFESGAAD